MVEKQTTKSKINNYLIFNYLAFYIFVISSIILIFFGSYINLTGSGTHDANVTLLSFVITLFAPNSAIGKNLLWIIDDNYAFIIIFSILFVLLLLLLVYFLVSRTVSVFMHNKRLHFDVVFRVMLIVVNLLLCIGSFIFSISVNNSGVFVGRSLYFIFAINLLMLSLSLYLEKILLEKKKEEHK